MALYVLFSSTEAHEWPAQIADEGQETWLAANPSQVQYGPFERVTIRDRGYRIQGVDTDGHEHVLAECEFYSRTTLRAHAAHPQQEPRDYPHFEVVAAEE